MRRARILITGVMVASSLTFAASDNHKMFNTHLDSIAAVNILNLAYDWIFPVNFFSEQQTITLEENFSYQIKNRANFNIVETGSWNLLNETTILLQSEKQTKLLRITRNQLNLLTNTGLKSVFKKITNQQYLPIMNNWQHWELTYIANQDVTEYNIRLNLNTITGEIHGNAGCNNFQGVMQLTPNANSHTPLIFGNVKVTGLNSSLKTCDFALLMEAEQSFLSALNATQSYQQTTDSLIFYDKKEQPLLKLKLIKNQ